MAFAMGTHVDWSFTYLICFLLAKWIPLVLLVVWWLLNENKISKAQQDAWFLENALQYQCSVATLFRWLDLSSNMPCTVPLLCLCSPSVQFHKYYWSEFFLTRPLGTQTEEGFASGPKPREKMLPTAGLSTATASTTVGEKRRDSQAETGSWFGTCFPALGCWEKWMNGRIWSNTLPRSPLVFLYSYGNPVFSPAYQ